MSEQPPRWWGDAIRFVGYPVILKGLGVEEHPTDNFHQSDSRAVSILLHSGSNTKLGGPARRFKGQRGKVKNLTDYPVHHATTPLRWVPMEISGGHWNLYSIHVALQ